MANNHTQFSEVIPCETKEQMQWLEEMLATAVRIDDEEEGYPVCDLGRKADGIWVHSSDWGDLEALVGVVCAFQQRFQITEPWSLTWADTCSRPRIGEFGGGAVVVCKGEAEWLHTWSWCEDRKRALKGGAA